MNSLLGLSRPCAILLVIVTYLSPVAEAASVAVAESGDVTRSHPHRKPKSAGALLRSDAAAQEPTHTWNNHDGDAIPASLLEELGDGEMDPSQPLPPVPQLMNVSEFPQDRKNGCSEDMTGKGTNYRGCQSRTRSGLPCAEWGQFTAGPHNMAARWKQEWKTWKPVFDLRLNYCRNVGGWEQTIWCYTNSVKTRFDICDPIPPPRTTPSPERLQLEAQENASALEDKKNKEDANSSSTPDEKEKSNARTLALGITSSVVLASVF